MARFDRTQGGNVQKRLLPLALLMGLISIAALACSGGGEAPAPAPQRQSPPPPPAANAPAAPSAPAAPANSAQPAATGGDARTVTLQDPGGSGSYAFDPNDLKFSVGDTIEFNFKSESEFHTFTVDDLGIDVEVDGGETVTFSHTFDQAGTFSLVCIPHEFLDMVGGITVQ